MRLFVALELSENLRSRLSDVQAALGRRCDGVRWVAVHQLHLTVKFLGEVADREVSRVSKAVAGVAVKSDPFDLTVGGCGCFPPSGPVRIVWAGGREDSGALGRCVDGMGQGLESLGFAREPRPFSPHITIGRVREDRSGGEFRTAVEAGTLDPMVERVASLTLMSSVLSPKGPDYRPIATHKLGSCW